MREASRVKMFGSRIIHEDIMEYEILSRLPVKSLMRFKSVCKRWCTLIQQDREFCELHLTRSETCQGRRLLYLMPLKGRNGMSFLGLQDCLLSVDDLVEGRAVVVDNTINKMESLDYASILNPVKTAESSLFLDSIPEPVKKIESSLFFDRILEPINGLVCLVKQSLYGVRIYNPSTREITPLIESTLVGEDKEHGLKEAHRYERTYGFGFDSVTKQHKVVCVWRGSFIKPTPHVACEVLTVGQNKWRRIDDHYHKVPSYNFTNSSAVYVKGSIYWSNKRYLGDNDFHEVIIAFDVGREKFRVIQVPNFIRNQPCDGKKHCGPHVDLLEFDGRVALSRRMDDYTVKLWIFDDNNNDDHSKEKTVTVTTTTTTSTISSNRDDWTEMTIKLPLCWDTNVPRLYFHSMPGTDHLILRAIEDQRNEFGYHEWLVSLYSYDWRKQTFKKIKIDGIFCISDPSYSTSRFTPFVGSLFPVSSSNGDTPKLTVKLKGEPVSSTQALKSPNTHLTYYV